MKVLVVGSGAREHAICWKLRHSRRVEHVLCAPGNPGIGEVAQLLPIGVTEVSALVQSARDHEVTLVVVGPEVALEAGIVDALQQAGIPVAGPTKAAARIEASKAFAKEVMERAGVPTARYGVFTDENRLREHCAAVGAPLVLKSDGLASGKGVFVITETQQFEPAFEALFKKLNATSIVAEEYLSGVEVTCIFATNGTLVIPLPPAHDYKRLGDNDQGPNTGGMGAVCPSPRLSAEELLWVQEHVAQPVVDTMRDMGIPFTGFLYAGLMVPEARTGGSPQERLQGIRVLEFNARLGDPECQAILARLSSDIVSLCEWVAGIAVPPPELSWSNEVSTCVVIASDGYPEGAVVGDRIDGLHLIPLVPKCVAFHAGTQRDSKLGLVSSGGRILSVVGLGASSDEARSIAYKGVDLVQMRGRRVRRDIGR